MSIFGQMRIPQQIRNVICRGVIFWGIAGAISPGYAEEQKPPRELLICGFAKLQQVNLEQLAGTGPASNQAIATDKWVWSALGRNDLPEPRSKKFGTTDEIKFVRDGTQLLVTSSGGGCALIQRIATTEKPAGSVLWSATVANAHSIEMLPGNKVVVAASTSKAGNKLFVFDLSQGDNPIAETPLYSAHGVVWDTDLNRIFAVGYQEINRYELATSAAGQLELKREATYPLPDEGGHDLQPVPESRELVVSTHDHVYLFDRTVGKFHKHPVLGDRAHIKCVSVRAVPQGLETAFVQASDQQWWSQEIGHFVECKDAATINAPKASEPVIIKMVPLEKFSVYKVRWIPSP